MTNAPASKRNALLISALAAACGGGGVAPASPGMSAPSTPSTTSVGAAGGTVSLASGAVRLSIPAGALTGSVALDARPSAAVAPLDPWVVGGSIYEISPPSQTFSTAAVLAIRYEAGLRPSGTALQDFRIHRLVGSSWEPLSGTMDPALSEAAASITSTGIYSVRWVGPPGPCSLPEDRQFDFWLGDWNLIDETQGQPGRPAGVNTITRDETGCLIEENYRASVHGRSTSLFSRVDRRWHQTYIDSAGNRGVLVGSFASGRMTLADGPRRSYWEPLNPDTIHFVQDLSRDGGQTWTPFFDSRYTRR